MFKREPKISIITASYNYQDLIVTAIESIISQTYKNWELIIVDDGSSDNSIDVIKKYVEKYDNIFLFQHENGVNKGLKDTIKLGIEKFSSDYIAFLEADDYWTNDCLEKRVEVINKHPEVGFIFNDVELFGEQKAIDSFNKYFNEQKKLFKVISWPVNISLYLVLTNIVPTFSCITVKKVLFEKCDFETPYDPWLDWWLYAQIACKADFYFMDEKLTFWQRHFKSYTNPSNKKNEVKELQDKFKKGLIKKIQQNSKGFLNYILFGLLENKMLEKFFRGVFKGFLIFVYGFKYQA